MPDRVDVILTGDLVLVTDGEDDKYFDRSSPEGQALVELVERREADDTEPLPPATPATVAVESCVLARDAVKRALVEAITPDAHYSLSTAVSGLTQVVVIVEYSRKVDAH